MSEAEEPPSLTKPEAKSVETLRAVAFASYSGPLPPPETLAHYEEIMPGAARVIFDDFVEQARYRRSAEMKIIRSDVFRQIAGALSSSIIGIAGVTGGIWLLHEGKSVSGLAAFIGTLASLAGVLLNQQRLQAANDREAANRKLKR